MDNFNNNLNNNDDRNDGNTPDTSSVPNDEKSSEQTGSYSYTGDRLTDNKTTVGGSYSSRETEDRENKEPKKNTEYNPPYMNGNGGISYTPVSPKEDKKKSKKAKGVTFTKAGVAILCATTICLSAATGFLGAYAANTFMKQDTPKLSVNSNTPVNNGTNTGDVTISNVGGADDTAVFYRSVTTTGIGSSQNGNLTYREVASMVQDSVVEIVTDFNKTSLWFQYVASGAGSGVIMSEDGYVITNNHVISDEETGELSDSVTVRLRNGEEYKAEIIGADADSDIAVLKINATGLTPAVSGNSDNLAVGEEVLAVGNPLGELGGTVTNGIVSATDREIVVGDVTMNLIQTNAAVNPGNSGGGLFNMNGELIGIVNAKSSGTDVEGLGFAIPVNDALKVTEQLLEYGYVRGKVTIGVQFLDATDSSIARKYGLKQGLYVLSLEEGLNDNSLKPGDRIIAINGNEVGSFDDISMAVKASAVGDILTFQLYRDGKLVEAEVTVFERIPDYIEGGEVEFETETPGGDIYQSEDEEVFVSPMPDDDQFGYNPFEGTPFEDFFNDWGW